MSQHAGLNIYDFDRCHGVLTNPRNLPLPIIQNEGLLGVGVAVSPNNRFLYVSLTKELYQFDLWHPDIFSSIDTVGVFDNTFAPFAALFHTQQLGPDGKIYMSCGNGDTVYHVINRPDEIGDSCEFLQHSVHLSRPSLGVPNFPNYRLGTLSASICDTISWITDLERAGKEKILKVYPSPATDEVSIDYGFTDWSKGEVHLEIINELGQLIHQQPVPMYSGLQKIDVTQLASGLYTACIKRNRQMVSVAKFAKQ